MAAEDAGDGGGGWGALSELALKDCVELAPTPGGVLSRRRTTSVSISGGVREGLVWGLRVRSARASVPPSR